MTLLLALGATFGAVVLLAVTVQSVVADRRQVNRTLRSVRAIELTSSQDIRRKQMAAPITTRVIAPALRRAAALARRFTPAATVQRLDEELVRAGSPAAWDVGRVLAMKLLLPTSLVLAGLAFTSATGAGGLKAVALIAILGLAGWYVPEWVLRSRAGARQAEIQRAMPDSLDLLSITVQAGLGFDAALARVARESGGPLGEEFHRVVQEIQLGEERIAALRSLADRNAVPELKSFVLAMIQADILGISVSNVLEVQAKELRTRRRQRAEEQAQKLTVKIIFPLIFCIFPALFVVLLGPAAITIWETLFSAL